MVCWCSGRDNNVISSEKSHIADIQFAYSLFSQCPFFSKSGIFSDPLVLGKNDFVGSNEHIPWVSYIKLHLKMSGVNQLQISPPPTHSPTGCRGGDAGGGHGGHYDADGHDDVLGHDGDGDGDL